MLGAIGALLFVGVSNAYVHEWRCSEGGGQSVSVQKTDQPGSYDVEYCAPVSPDARTVEWKVSLSSFTEAPERCNGTNRPRLTTMHSYFEVALGPVENCTRVCASARLYLMYRACYRLRNDLDSRGQNSYFFADNNITGPKYFCNGSLFFNKIDADPPIFHLYAGRLHFSEYSVRIQRNNTKDEYTEVNCTSLDASAPAPGLRCTPQASISGCYELQLNQFAPWFSHHYYNDHCRHMHKAFCWSEEPGSAAEQRWSWALGAGVGAGAGALFALAAAALLWRSRYRSKMAKLFLKPRRSSEEAMIQLPETPPAVPRRVLLLYARDCAYANDVADELRGILEGILPGQVDDLYADDCVALMAPSPAEWVTAAMQHSQIVVLQTPALDYLYRRECEHPINDAKDYLRVEQAPRGIYREPHPSDPLLQYALRLLMDGPQPDTPYTRHFFCTIAKIPLDVFPWAQPFARYKLPASVHELVKHVAPHAPVTHALVTHAAQHAPLHLPTRDHPPTDTRDLTLAIDRLYEHHRENPNYARNLFFVF